VETVCVQFAGAAGSVAQVFAEYSLTTVGEQLRVVSLAADKPVLGNGVILPECVEH
jgi:hypothetical protein